VATISVAKNREDIGAYHNEGDGVPKREWFGISKKAEKDIVRMVELRIQEMIRRA
jgi:phage gpG-like protein